MTTEAKKPGLSTGAKIGIGIGAVGLAGIAVAATRGKVISGRRVPNDSIAGAIGYNPTIHNGLVGGNPKSKVTGYDFSEKKLETTNSTQGNNVSKLPIFRRQKRIVANSSIGHFKQASYDSLNPEQEHEARIERAAQILGGIAGIAAMRTPMAAKLFSKIGLKGNIAGIVGQAAGAIPGVIAGTVAENMVEGKINDDNKNLAQVADTVGTAASTIGAGASTGVLASAGLAALLATRHYGPEMDRMFANAGVKRGIGRIAAFDAHTHTPMMIGGGLIGAALAAAMAGKNSKVIDQHESKLREREATEKMLYGTDQHGRDVNITDYLERIDRVKGMHHDERGNLVGSVKGIHPLQTAGVIGFLGAYPAMMIHPYAGAASMIGGIAAMKAGERMAKFGPQARMFENGYVTDASEYVDGVSNIRDQR